VRGQRQPPIETDDLRVISTVEDAETEAGETAPRNSRSRAARPVAPANQDERSMRRTIEQLNGQITRLSAELSDMREQQKTLVNFERLSRAEQRAEAYRAQLRDVVQREATLQARLEQIEFDILPENIEQRAAGNGSLRSEQVREQMRRMLDSERTRSQSQLELLTQSRLRLEQAIITADAEVARISESVNDTTTRANAATTPATPTITPTDATTYARRAADLCRAATLAVRSFHARCFGFRLTSDI
jgi:predicted RNase H-like nuclease (RuvC/YqgF family)